MKRSIFIKRILPTLLACALASAAGLAATAKNAVEACTTSDITASLGRYHIASTAQVQNGLVGGEGAQLVFSIDMSPFDSNLMLLSNDTVGIYKSVDGGASWEHSAQGVQTPMVTNVRFDPDNPDVAYALGGTASASAQRMKYGKLGLYKSYDKGASWTFIIPIETVKAYTGTLAYSRKLPDKTRYIFAGANTADAYDGVCQGMTGIFRSSDQGETWQCMGLEDRTINSIYCDDTLDLLIVCSDCGVEASYDYGASWVTLNGGQAALNASAIAVNPENKSHWIAGINDVGAYLIESLDGGNTWTRIGTKKMGLDGCYVASLDFRCFSRLPKPRLFMTVYHLSEPERYSDDYGRTFTVPAFNMAQTYIPMTYHQGYFPTPYCFDPQNPETVFTSKITVCKSTDGGETFAVSAQGYSGFLASDWHFDADGKVDYIAIADLGVVKMDPSHDTVFSPAAKICAAPSYDGARSSTAIAVDPQNPLHGYATMGGAIYGKSATALETFDGFETFTPVAAITSALETEGLSGIRSVAYHPQNDRIVYADWFVSRDNGASWSRTDKKISGVSPINGDIVYSLEDYRLYRSSDCGGTWADTGLSVPASGRYRAFEADRFYEDVLWLSEYSRVYRVDIARAKITVMDGGNNKFVSDAGGTLEASGIAQNPRDKQHLIVSFRDYNSSGSYIFETFDSGVNWYPIDGVPYLAYAANIKFHPTQNLAFFGSPLGTLVYRCDRGRYVASPKLTAARYSRSRRSFTMSGSMGSAYHNAPVVFELVGGETGGNYGYKNIISAYTDDFGYFSFTADNITPQSGRYAAAVRGLCGEAALTCNFNTTAGAPQSETPEVFYDPLSGNLVVYGACEQGRYTEGDAVSIMMKRKAADNITGENIQEAVAHIGMTAVDASGRYLYKFRFDGSVSDYDITVSLMGETVVRADIETVAEGYSPIVLTLSGENGDFDLETDAVFHAKADIAYFFEEELSAALLVACYDAKGALSKVFQTSRRFDYLPEAMALLDGVPSGTVKVRCFLWNGLTALAPLAGSLVRE